MLSEFQSKLSGSRNAGLNIFALKMIAFATMLVDHIAASGVLVLNTDSYMLMRTIGRIAFPIFVFCLAEGASHTKNIRKYELRLLLFAVISEIPFDLGLYHTLPYLHHQNVFFTLLMGLLVIDIIMSLGRFADKSEKKAPVVRISLLWILPACATFCVCFVADLIEVDYGFCGVLLIVCMYIFRNHRVLQAAVTLAIFLVFRDVLGTIELYGIIAFVPIFFYNGRRGPDNKAIKAVSYMFYPVHLSILGVVYML